jgi:hypothetical protein
MEGSAKIDQGIQDAVEDMAIAVYTKASLRSKKQGLETKEQPKKIKNAIDNYLNIFCR